MHKHIQFLYPTNFSFFLIYFFCEFFISIEMFEFLWLMLKDVFILEWVFCGTNFFYFYTQSPFFFNWIKQNNKEWELSYNSNNNVVNNLMDQCLRSENKPLKVSNSFQNKVFLFLILLAKDSAWIFFSFFFLSSMLSLIYISYSRFATSPHVLNNNGIENRRRKSVFIFFNANYFCKLSWICSFLDCRWFF